MHRPTRTTRHWILAATAVAAFGASSARAPAGARVLPTDRKAGAIRIEGETAPGNPTR